MIRILHYGLSSHLGGIETYLFKLYKNIDRTKYKFDFLVNGDETPCFYNEFKNMGSQFYSVTSRAKNPINNKKDLVQLFKQEKFDIVHCHMNSLSYLTPILAAVKYTDAVIVHSRNAKPPKSIKTKLLHNFNTVLLPKKKVKMLAVSDLAGKWMFGEESEFSVINNGINIDTFKYDEVVRNKMRNDLGLNDCYSILHVGAFREQKNHSFLLEIFKEILALKPDSKLLLVGTGALESKIREKASRLGVLTNIIFLGNRSDIPQLLSASDIFLFPSFYEGFPNAVLEAQTSGLPCLISDNITEEVLINDNCFAFPLNKSPKEWAEKLLSIETHENRIMVSKKISEKGFSVKDEIIKVEGIYQNLLNLK